MSYYDTLGVKPGANKDEIKSAYRRLAKKYHPDVKGTGNNKKFLEIQNAYEALMRGETNQRQDDPFGGAGDPFGGDQDSPFSHFWRAQRERQKAQEARQQAYQNQTYRNPFEGFWETKWDEDIGGKARSTYKEPVSGRLVRQLLQYDVDKRPSVYSSFSWECDGCHKRKDGGTNIYYFANGEKKLCLQCKKDIYNWLKDDDNFDY